MGVGRGCIPGGSAVERRHPNAKGAERRWQVSVILQSVPGPSEVHWKKSELYLSVPWEWNVDRVMERLLERLNQTTRKKSA